MTKEAILEHWLPTPEGSQETHDILKAMSDYAKQQAIAFMKWAMECALCGDNYGGVFIINEKETKESLYSQFIEQQTKDK